jgi:hypothetical protein
MGRKHRIVGIFGGPGNGKTTFARLILEEARVAGARCRIVDPKMDFRGGEMPSDPEAWMRTRLEKKDCDFLLLDDADAYIPKSLPPSKSKRGDAENDGDTARITSPWRELALRNRHHKIDVLMTVRRAQEVPNVMLSAMEYAVVFKFSPMDVPGRKRILEAVPGLELPREGFKFVLCNLDSGERISGRTLPRAPYVEWGAPLSPPSDVPALAPRAPLLPARRRPK